jgi:hypothetical protein
MAPLKSVLSRGTGITGDYNDSPLSIKVITALLRQPRHIKCLELLAVVFLTFSRSRGVYFWFLLVASWGYYPLLGILTKFFNRIPRNSWVSEPLLTIRWWTMVTGQSVVL